MATGNHDIAVIGSPSTNTELTLDLLQEATEEKIIGLLSAFSATQDGKEIVSIGQITGIELKNRWHEDSVFRNLLKRTGEIPPITNRQDTRTAQFSIGASFKQSDGNYDPDVLGMVPPTGTRVYKVEQALLDEILRAFKKDLFYLGYAYANDVRYPMWFKHFGPARKGGTGEAYHIGVFGKSGSGKSTLAKMMLCGYSCHKDMGILIVDPQGEFSLEFSGQTIGRQGLRLNDIVQTQRPIYRFSLKNIQLRSWTLFCDLLLVRKVVRLMGIAAQPNQVIAAGYMVSALRSKSYKLDKLHENQDALTCALEGVIKNSGQIYTQKPRAEQLVQTVQEIMRDTVKLDDLMKLWNLVARMFASGDGRRKIVSYSESEPLGIVNMLVTSERGSRPLVVIDISEQGNRGYAWSEEMQKRVLALVMKELSNYSAQYLNTDSSSNILVVLDEAHRHAPSGTPESDEGKDLKNVLKRAVRETRKYGLGWCFISQSLGGLDAEILGQLRMSIFGFGLAFGLEFDRLKDFAGGDKRALELYQSFRDPEGFPRPELKEYPFMAVGPISPLSFAGKPIFFSAFTNPMEFMSVNSLEVQDEGGSGSEMF